MSSLDMDAIQEVAVARGAISLSDNAAGAVVAEVGRQLAAMLEAETLQSSLRRLGAGNGWKPAALVREWTGAE